MDRAVENVAQNKCGLISNSMTLNGICNWNHHDRIAIEYHDIETCTDISYANLHNAKEIVSNYLADISDSQFIGISFDVVEYCVPSLMLGITSSGHGFVNLPVEQPLSNNLIDSLSIKYLLVQNIPIDGKTIGQLKIHDQQIYLVKLKNTQGGSLRIRKENCYAYAITTSGSTGVPKIVRVPHASIVPNIADLKRILSITELDKVAQLTSFTFDPCIVEIFLAFSNAATLFVVSKSLKQDANRLIDKIYRNKVTVLQLTPSVFLYNWSTARIKSTVFNNDSSLRILLFGGEPFPKKESLFETKHPQNCTKIFNIYGITEVSCWASICEISQDRFPNSHFLGCALSHTVFQVRSEVGDIVKKGEGSLYIGSSSRICLIDDEKIEDLPTPIFRDSGDLVQIDEEGRIFYKGRKNRIVKRFGNKLDLQTVEDAALRMDFVKNCYVLWVEEKHKLHLCLTTTKNSTEYPDLKTEVMKHLQKLRPICRPDEIHFLDHFELTTSGKISVEFLREQCINDKKIPKDLSNVEFSNVQRIFRAAWELHLGVVNDGFVKLGGTSVIALQISSAISEDLNIEFPELIGMLLKDSKFEECLAYIQKTVVIKPETHSIEYFENHSIARRITTSMSLPQKIITADSVHPTKHENVCQLHKCRGKTNVNILSMEQASESTVKNISSIEVVEAYDLQKCVDASPTVFQYSDGKSYATVGSHFGVICTLELGEKTEATPYKIKLPDRIEASVLVLDDFIGIVGCYDAYVYCLNLKTGDTIWKYQTGDVVKCTAITCEERRRVFVGSYDCHVYCLSVEDGCELWSVRCGGGSVSASGCLHSRSNSVLFGTLDGSCLALQQSSGQVSWRSKLGDPIFVAPVTLSSDLALFCTVAGTLSCFDIEINVEMWKYKINGNVFSYILTHYDPITQYENVILASQNRSVYCLESWNRSPKAEFALKYVLNFHSSLYATPWRVGDFLFTTCTDGTLSVHDVSKNVLLNSIKLPGATFSSPVVHDNFVIVGCRDNNAYVLKLT